jgi:type IV secretory pathway VirB2 component (pilin)
MGFNRTMGMQRLRLARNLCFAFSDGQLILRLSIAVMVITSILFAQSPWTEAARRLEEAFTGPIARGFSLVAVVLGGLQYAFSEGGGKRTIGAIIFGVGMAMMAVQFVTWLFG